MSGISIEGFMIVVINILRKQEKYSVSESAELFLSTTPQPYGINKFEDYCLKGVNSKAKQIRLRKHNHIASTINK